MVQVKVNEISQKIEDVMTRVEKGENCLILKKGKPIAEILPIKTKSQGWKREINKIKLPKGGSGQSSIEHERSLL
jgi:prevent-host-death family protein